MAERVEPKSRESSAAEQAAEDLTVMFPSQKMQLLGSEIAVQEYPFMTWVELKPRCLAIIEAFSVFIEQDEIQVDELLECFENHFQIVKILISKSIQQDESFLAQLTDAEMQLLMLTWWSVNKHFFLRSASRLLRAKTKQQSDGQTSFSN